MDERWLLTDEERATKGMGPWTKLDDPAHSLLTDGHTSSTTVHDDRCYICNDPEFAQMGLPLCRECPACREAGRGLGHVPADDCVCTVCGYDEQEQHDIEQALQSLAASFPCHDDDPPVMQRTLTVNEYGRVRASSRMLGAGSKESPDFWFTVERWERCDWLYCWEWMDAIKAPKEGEF